MESLNAALLADLANSGRARYFVRLAFKSGDVLLHTGVGERRFKNRTWHGVGMLGTVSEIPASDKNDSARIRLTLHTQDQAVLAEVAENDPISLGCEIYLVTVDEHYRVSQSQILESGYIVACDVERGDVSQIQLSIAGESERWKDARLHQRWNDATQKALHPGDKFFSEQTTANKQKLRDTQPGKYIGDNRHERQR
ncbi:hypothetical protein PNIG_a2055 [Pseudoalteromonas nigrifaciens]|jgi:hypothetical protein|uniref:Uncharacterized protein n=2 Tax=Pseudoalteromonas TaxID=53246 RepID=Q3IGN2_PSET1|nr:MULTISPECIES: hypothetical protein [Pseudoalteromonas]ASM54116.1 hypothetical protein PNIG_a2055 [Pseudoalteromonas nigrifaciens]MBB1404845.1 hypothetical protein [Pseudoalteromonas sp. SG44-5]CAI86627.1 conserved protein of unknown function [Pseudoalteromonas translucida]SUC52053.1 Uncharacterised protein [Pseudoalteromonas nigrifaciens]GEN42570.1 hypothetical protein PNI02_20360 [Pseudoalteromonas nigrifaciens]